MRYSLSTVVLAALAVTQVTASPHGHQHIHAKKHAEDKRDLANVDWSKIQYTYTKGQTWGQPTPAPAVPAPKSKPQQNNDDNNGGNNDKTNKKNNNNNNGGNKGGNSGQTKSSDAVGDILDSTHASKLVSMGLKAVGLNSKDNSKGVWIGDDGQYTNEFTNDGDDDLILVVWGDQGSWVNSIQPLVTMTIPKGQSKTLSFASGQSGAWSTISKNVQLANGQISNTWGEFTFGPEGVVNVSREPNMSGNAMKIEGPQCTTDMDRCVFVCNSGNTCMTGYTLQNCAAGSQPGAQTGTYGGADSGGCGGLGNAAKLKTSVS